VPLNDAASSRDLVVAIVVRAVEGALAPEEKTQAQGLTSAGHRSLRVDYGMASHREPIRAGRMI
jgi:hypothetical protein